MLNFFNFFAIAVSKTKSCWTEKENPSRTETSSCCVLLCSSEHKANPEELAGVITIETIRLGVTRPHPTTGG